MPYAKEEREFFDPETLPREQVEGYPGGVSERVISRDPESGDYTRLLYFEPGTETTERLEHDFWEEVYICSGYLIDKTRNETFTAGMVCTRPPGMKHGPYSTPEGCVTYETRYYR